jgi:hypothetical protein
MRKEAGVYPGMVEEFHEKIHSGNICLQAERIESRTFHNHSWSAKMSVATNGRNWFHIWGNKYHIGPNV